MDTLSASKKIADHYDAKVALGAQDLNQRITDGIIVHHHEGLVSEDELATAEKNRCDQRWLEEFIYQKEMDLLPTLIEPIKAELMSAGRILDAGCGRGGAAIQLAQATNADITGLSLSPGQITFGIKSVERLKLENRVHLQVGDMLETGLTSNSYDFIMALGSSEHVSDLSKMFAEFYRLAASGALLMVYTWAVNYDFPQAAEFKQQVDQWYETDIHSPQQYIDALENSGWHADVNQDRSASGARYWSVRALLDRGSGSEVFMTPGFNSGALGYQLIIAHR